MRTKLMKLPHPPPVDQTIVDEYFKLRSLRSSSSISWLYGMLATYGITINELKGFTWNSDNTLTILSKKRKVKPIHPQWFYLFELKEKQPSNLEDCLETIQLKLMKAIENQKIKLNFTDLQLAYQIRKNYYQKKKEYQRKESPASLVLS